MTFPEIFRFRNAVLMFKSLNGLSPDYLKYEFTQISDVHSHPLRSSANLQLYSPKPNSELYRKSFAYSGIYICNSVPVYIKNAKSLNQCKAYCIKYAKKSLNRI